MPNDNGAVNSDIVTLEQCLQEIISHQDLANSRQTVKKLAKQLNISLLDCAAALLLSHPVLPEAIAPSPVIVINEISKPHYKLVRYRLDIGSQHFVEKEQIQAVLVQESGVDKKRIGKIDIRHNYTLVELPEGMPADIFQLLSEATINDRKLAIKRIKSNRRPVKS